MAFDSPVTVAVYKEIIMELELIDFPVLITTCDQGSKNEGLAKQLGITKDKYWSQNPADPTRDVLWCYDFVHVFKNDRNHTLDQFKLLGDGTGFCKQDFQDLFDYVKKNNEEVSCGFFLKQAHLECVSQDRQDTRLAVQLFSDRTAALFRRFFPNDPSKKAAADYCDLIFKGSLVF